MAAILPKPFAWQSNHNNRHLRLHGKIKNQVGVLEFTEEDPNHIFTTEDPHKSGYVNIKYSGNNLYLTGVPSPSCPTGENSTLLVVATSETTINETDDKKSTLFELVKSESTNDTQVVFRVRHVYSNLYLRPHKVIDGSDAVLCAVKPDPDPEGVDLFTAIGCQ